MIEETDLLARRGGIAQISTLEADGASRLRLQKLVDCGAILRPRRGWYALPNADPLLLRATALGGVVTCISALRKFDVWCVDDQRLHLAIPAHSGHLPRRSGGLALHYSSRVVTHEAPRIVSVLDALVEQFGCQSGENVVVALDSALNKGLIRLSDLDELRSRVPKKYWPLIECADGNCESGLETKVRLRLGRRGLRYRTQAGIPGVGRVDVLIGDRLVLETDGLDFHTGKAAINDRERDLVLHRLGYIVVRVSYDMVMYRWDEVEAVINAYVGRREHRWSTRHVRAGLVAAGLR